MIPSSVSHPDGMKSEIGYEQFVRLCLVEELTSFIGLGLRKQTLEPDIRINQIHQSPRQSNAFFWSSRDVYSSLKSLKAPAQL